MLEPSTRTRRKTGADALAAASTAARAMAAADAGLRSAARGAAGFADRHPHRSSRG